ncbi:hypothetical protein [Paenibacillus sp. UASWS1643]|uniref:hypothetical protein n=1 Tax=Paenibacillus sp. UASWS1643 TaxID=2580422 RepID=UPI00123A3F79|nr:hypothetical protein [Paenibacillus sp. UASWS1643]KAA8750180.1 hypothetical protein FE296_16440 [Paenibacillus sp. UASWS1643]
MAKLNVVIPAVEVTVGGVTYRKVDRKAQAGDIVKALKRDTDIAQDAFYGPLYKSSGGTLGFKDNVNDFRYSILRNRPENLEVYEKVTDSAAVEYREVKRKAVVGERIRITNRVIGEDRYVDGDEFAVNSVDSDGDVRVNAAGSDRALVLRREYVVLKPVSAKPAEPERLKVGDYARYVRDGNNRMVTGDIVEITEIDQSAVPYRVRRLSDNYVAWAPANKIVRATDEEVAKAVAAKDPRSQFAVGDYVKVAVEYCEHNVGDVLKISATAAQHDFYVTNVATSRLGCIDAAKLVKLSAEEVAEIERKQAEESRWAAIGRKVNEYKRGDIVLCVGKAKAGLGEVQADANGGRVSVKYYSSFGTCSETFGIIALVSPVEQRFDRPVDDVTEEVDAA